MRKGLEASCPFCHIADGEAPASIVYEDHSTIAFLPLHPATKGHVLVIPKAHFADIWAISRPEFEYLSATVWRVAQGVRTAFAPEGLNIINSTGEVATQSVPHLHMHIVPRWAGDPMNLTWPPKRTPSTREREGVARAIRRELS